MFYEKKVIYLDYLVKNERCGNAGFLKMEARGETCNLTINVSNLRPADILSAKVYLVCGGREQELCEVKIVQGKGVKCLLQQDMLDVGHTGIAYEELCAVRIPLGAEREIYGVVRCTDAECVDMKYTDVKNADVEKAVKCVSTESAVKESAARLGTDEDESTEKGDAPDNCRGHENSDSVSTGEVVGKENAEDKQIDQKTPRTFPLLDDKWKQLWAIYPHITPFQDEREYLSFGPNDFVILPGKYFKMANNSFLLHGYHNYNHLILKKMEYRGETRYYIGVPGNFYDREKQVAVMFGFESFESLDEPARTGDYGYYLMRIEL